MNASMALPVMEIFYSLQGEGFHQGKAASFIRLGGCDVGCHWCDVKDSWKAEDFSLIPVEEIAHQVAQNASNLVIVTGGEPLMYDLGPLTKALKGKGLQVHLETSGVHPLSGQWDWITFSPKKFKPPLPEIFEMTDELKIVIYHSSDISWAVQVANTMRKDCKLYLQPEWGNSKKMLPLIIDFVKSNPRWRVSLQVHKYMDIP
ncbi:MAG: 7-carboxy-7-deazaguanine synthase QueE [Cyclobacteriaceae bacterium]|nr:7-carboxy-7-deazaguanine synthase QueE [Cyclobacteriaceae bacterium]